MARGLLMGALVVGILANLGTFRSIEARARHNYRAWHAYESGDVMLMAILRDDSVRRYLGPFYFFGELFPGSTVVVPRRGADTWFSLQPSLQTFGRAAEIQRLAYDAAEPPETAAWAAARIPASDFVPRVGATRRVIDERVSYYATSERARAFVVFAPDGPPGRTGHMMFVDMALLDAEWLSARGLGSRGE
jgi:hypothetical protein